MFCRLLQAFCRWVGRVCPPCGTDAGPAQGRPSRETLPRPPGGTARPPQAHFAVYLRDVSGLPYDDKKLAALEPAAVFGEFAKVLLAGWGDPLTLRLRTAFKGDPAALQALVRRATANAKQVGLRGYVPLEIEHHFLLAFPPQPRRPATDLLCDLKAWARTRGGTVSVSQPTRPASVSSGYLEPAPLGTGVTAVQGGGNGPGLDGSGQLLVDIERGWCPRPDVPSLGLAGWVGAVESLGENDVLHAVQSASVVLGGHARTTPGIAPKATFRKALCFDPASSAPVELVASAILGAGVWLHQNAPHGRGVILIEQQTDDFRPIEVDPWVFAAIQTVSAAGQVVIEPAGTQPDVATSGQDALDAMVGQFFEHDNSTVPPGRVLRERSLAPGPNVPDSGAIVVAGGIPEDPVAHQRHPLSNHGQLVDCWAWGESIASEGVLAVPDPLDAWQTTWAIDGSESYAYGGTSGASAIIAGVVLLIQQARAHAGQLPLTALQLRALFKPVPEGAPPGTPGLGELAGRYMPELAAMLPRLPAIPEVAIVDPGPIG